MTTTEPTYTPAFLDPENVLLEFGPAPAEPSGITAAARDDKSDGAMIALVPTLHDLERLALDGFEPPDDLHLTLFYLGDADKITPTQINELVTGVIQEVRDEEGDTPILANAFGVAHWNPESDYPAWVLNVGDEKPAEDGDTSRERVTGLADVRHMVEHVLEDLRIDYPPQHSPWQPHVCIAYSKDDLYGELASRLGPLTFDVLRVAWGEYDIDIRLVEQVTASVVTEEFHLPGRHNQKSHGNRKSKPSQDTVSPTTTSEDDFTRRAREARTGTAAYTLVPINDEASLRDVAVAGQLNGRSVNSIINSIDEYQELAYEDINGHLRANDGDLSDADPEIVRYTRDIDAVMESSQLTDDVLVYRGIWSANDIFGDAWRPNGDNTGLEWEDSAFVSTSVDGEIIDRISNASRRPEGVNMRILVPRGTPAFGIDPESFEKELLLNRGQRYRIMRDYSRDGARWIDVEVIR